MKNNFLSICIILIIASAIATNCAKSTDEQPRKDGLYKKALLECREGASEIEIANAMKTLNADDSQVVLELSECLELNIPAARKFQSYKTMNEAEEKNAPCPCCF